MLLMFLMKWFGRSKSDSRIDRFFALPAKSNRRHTKEAFALSEGFVFQS
jgi:hypothetical protein